jgi:hypothetical protein
MQIKREEERQKTRLTSGSLGEERRPDGKAVEGRWER